ncbi:MAG: c-type cytochrome [Burkholderiales bacterium]
MRNAVLCASLLMAVGAARAEDPLLARNLAAVCANCHGTDGHARGDLIKPLAGMPAERMVTTLAGFRSGALPATVMHQIAKGFSDDQVKAIATYFAAQPAQP